MNIERGSFLAPFALGTFFGVVSGAVLGVLFGHRLFTLVVSIWSMATRHEDDQVRFDLLLQ